MSLKHLDKEAPFPPVQDTVLRVYSMRFCPYAQRTLLVLEHKNVPYEVVNINLKSKPAWFLERTPVGTVPVIEKGGEVIYESTATSEWIDDVYPCPRLAPTDPLIKAQDRMLLEYFGKISSAFYGVFMKEDERESIYAALEKHYKHYEAALAKREGPFFGGASPSLLDFYIWPHLERIAVFAVDFPAMAVKENDCPALARWYASMNKLPAVKKLSFPIETHKYFFKSYKEGKPDYDFVMKA